MTKFETRLNIGLKKLEVKFKTGLNNIEFQWLEINGIKPVKNIYFANTLLANCKKKLLLQK